MFKFIKKLFKNDDEEIERKWLINDIPNYILKRTTCMPYIQIKQKYLAINNVEEIRIRELKTYRKYTLMDGKYYIGVKRGSGLVREEKRLPILKHTFNDLNSSNNDIPIIFFITTPFYYFIFTLYPSLPLGNLSTSQTAEI